MIVENKASENGDVIYIKVEVPIVGLLTLNSFADSTTNESVGVYFKKEFRYALDGFNFYPWQELTNPNVAAIQVQSSDLFMVEYRYTRIGSDFGDILFNNVSLFGDTVDLGCSNLYKETIFAKFFACTDLEVLLWAINVLEKCYKKGLISEFIDRNLTNNFEDDEDYISFWRSITTFFAYIVVYARKFRDFASIQVLLNSYLLQKGLFLRNTNTDLEELTYYKENFFKEYSSRGTIQMIRLDNDDTYEGEMLRMINKGQYDEFIFCLLENHNQGWNINNSSPLWKGNNSQKYMNKAYENTQDILEISKYPIFGDVSIVLDDSKSVARIDGDTAGQRNGIGNNPFLSSFDLSKAITISPYISYKITFQIRQPQVLGNNFSFGCLVFDKNGNKTLLKNIRTNSITDFFFQKKKLNKVGNYYEVKGIIFHADQTLLPQINSTLKIGFGDHLKFGDTNGVQIIPVIFSDTTSGVTGDNSFYIWDFKVTPLETYQSNFVVNGQNLIKMWYKNNNTNFSNDEIENNLRHFFIPYASKLSTIEVNDPRPIIRLPSFDFAVVNYIWNSEGGRDLDTRTAIINVDTTVDGDDVGWARGNTVGNPPDYYLKFGGDNTGLGGIEAVLVDFNKMSSDFSSINEYQIRLRAFWYSLLFSGDIIVKLTTYIGGTMQQVGTNFVNVGGTLVSEVFKPVNLQTVTGADVDGDDCGIITYYKDTKSAILS